jgi:hypothetical protein
MAHDLLKNVETYAVVVQGSLNFKAIELNGKAFIYTDFKCTCEQRNKGIVTLIPGRFQ